MHPWFYFVHPCTSPSSFDSYENKAVIIIIIIIVVNGTFSQNRNSNMISADGILSSVTDVSIHLDCVSHRLSAVSVRSADKPVCNDHLYYKIYYLWFIQ